jgi:lysozyme
MLKIPIKTDTFLKENPYQSSDSRVGGLTTLIPGDFILVTTISNETYDGHYKVTLVDPQIWGNIAYLFNEHIEYEAPVAVADNNAVNIEIPKPKPKLNSRVNPWQLTTDNQGLDLIKHFEGCELTSYRCASNVITIGFGNTSRARTGMTITQSTADAWLIEDVKIYENGIKRLCKVDLLQQEFSSLVAWAFNCGLGALEESTLLRILNQGNYQGVPEQIKRWDKGGGRTLPGLTRRRKAEAHLWTTGRLKFNF